MPPSKSPSDGGTTPRPSPPTGSPPSSSGSDSERLLPLFEALRQDSEERVRPEDVLTLLRCSGFRRDDHRVSGLFHRLEGRGQAFGSVVEPMDSAAFCSAIQDGVSVLERSITNDLVIPDFTGFSARIERIFEDVRGHADGSVASYIPQLARVPAHKWGLGLCTVDGQRLQLGDAEERFCVQSTCKPINYCLALEDNGAEKVHQHVGFEPSGTSFNDLSLNRDGRPHNPMINAGAIMSCSLIGRELETADRFGHVMALWERLAGGRAPGFSNTVYLSERRTADRNFALGYFMREHGAFPEDTNLQDTLEFYFQCCSLETTAEIFSIVAATLANGGVCPLTNERVLQPDTVRKCLSLMGSCGMYDYSGQWAFSVGLPAKSGVSGAIMVVVPDTLGFCVWSPRLDEVGNSARGIAFCRRLVEEFNFHEFDNVSGGISGKKDPRLARDHEDAALLAELLWSASRDDVAGIQRALVRGQSLAAADYDGRTALHVAASDGRMKAIDFLIARGVPLAPCDRWGGRPVDDARREGHEEAVSRLERAMGPAAARTTVDGAH